MKRRRKPEGGTETRVSVIRLPSRLLVTMSGVLWDQPHEWAEPFGARTLEGAIVRVDPPAGTDRGAVEALERLLLDHHKVAAVKVLPVPAEKAAPERVAEEVPEGEGGREAAMALVDALPGDREPVRAAVEAALSAACL